MNEKLFKIIYWIFIVMIIPVIMVLKILVFIFNLGDTKEDNT